MYENATMVFVLADVVVGLLVPAGPFVLSPDKPLARINPRLTFSVIVEFKGVSVKKMWS